ncbi:unnamed protein product [Arctogadus glacialis]
MLTLGAARRSSSPRGKARVPLGVRFFTVCFGSGGRLRWPCGRGAVQGAAEGVGEVRALQEVVVRVVVRVVVQVVVGRGRTQGQGV